MIKTDAINAGTNETATRQVFITRTLDAPRELVFKAWSTKEHLENWYAPNGCTIKIFKLDFRVGGIFLHRIETPDGFTCTCKGVFVEIDKPGRIVYSLAFSDENGNLIDSSQAGNHDDWPNETTVTVTFEEINGRTMVHLHQTVSEALAKQTGAYPSWLEMFDRLSTELAKY
ncbi:MAG TPA: SRPBCC domain-containing protein [Chitinophagaceae bacterium]